MVAQLEGLGRGARHRLFSKTNRYEGVFWPVDEALARRTPFTLWLLSIRALKGEITAHDVSVGADDSDLRAPSALGLNP
jgi:hypothetical protein